MSLNKIDPIIHIKHDIEKHINGELFTSIYNNLKFPLIMEVNDLDLFIESNIENYIILEELKFIH